MPIHGLTQTTEKIPEIGRLRKGEEATAGKIGRDLKYFRFTAVDEKQFEERFLSVFGQQPTRIPFYLPYGDIERNFESWMLEFGKSGLKRQCDAQVIQMELGPDELMQVYEHGAGPPCLMSSGGCQCKPRGRLAMLIPQLQRYGIVSLLTGSKHDIMTISGMLVHLHRKMEMAGRSMTEIPLVVSRHDQKVSTRYKRKGSEEMTRTQTVKSLLRIEILPEWLEANAFMLEEVTTFDAVQAQNTPVIAETGVRPEQAISPALAEFQHGPEVHEGFEEGMQETPSEEETKVMELIDLIEEKTAEVGLTEQYGNYKTSFWIMSIGRRFGHLGSLSTEEMHEILGCCELLLRAFDSEGDRLEFLQEQIINLRDNPYLVKTFSLKDLLRAVIDSAEFVPEESEEGIDPDAVGPEDDLPF